MTRATGTTLVRFPQWLLSAARKEGISPGDVLRSAGIRKDELTAPDARIPTHRLAALWKAILARSDDPLLGVRMGLEFRIRDAGLVGYTMVHSATLGSAVQRLVRYDRILEDVLPIDLLLADSHAAVVYQEIPELKGLGRPIEADLAAIVSCLREITERGDVPERVELPHAPPEDPRQHRRLFGCDLRFHQTRAAIVIKPEHMKLPIVAADETLCNYLDRSAEQVISNLADASFPQRVRRAIWDELSGGQPTLERIASTLAISPRTLQRRLEEDGLTYAVVLRDFRRDMAIELLARRDLAIYQVAFMLGYSDPSSFFKAFRRWEGVSPRQYREQRDEK